MKTKDRAAGPVANGVPVPGQPAGPVAPPRVSARRRRPGLIALSLALIAAGGAGVVVLVLQTGHRTQVVTVTRDVQVGEVITEADLGEASISLDPAVKAVKVGDRDAVIGKHAAVELRPGSLLAPSQVTSRSLVRAGEQVVPVGLKPEEVPASALAPGQKVRLVHVPAQGEEAPAKDAQTQDVVAARVVKAGDAAPGTGVVVVDVAAKAGDAPRLAAWVASDTVRLVLDAPGGTK
ncbi:SAF domain-containing protein [Streptomyces sp. G5(2025)]|uniref:SAF domain-containing protein n=1 Tax=Streptomyces sp. G5(2025) TaxID=3406628 RepID=UPI003C216CFB